MIEQFPLTDNDQCTIAKAAWLAYNGRHNEAEAVRFAAGYHNLGSGQCPEPNPVRREHVPRRSTA